MVRKCIIAIIALACASCASQGSEPRPLKLQYHFSNEADSRKPRMSGECIWVIDKRQRQTFYGAIISSEDVEQWLRDGVEAQLGMAAEPAKEIPRNGSFVELTRAYINPIATSISGVVVLRVSDGVSDQVVRGRATRMNWWGSASELSNILSDALDTALYQVGEAVPPSANCLRP